MLFTNIFHNLKPTRCNVSWFIYFYRCTFTNIFPSYNQQDAMFLDLFISTDALHEYISKLQSTRCNVSWFIYFYRCSLTNIFPSYNQQDAIFLDLFISTDALSRIYFPIYIQQDATFLDLFISTDALHENISKLQSTRCNVSWFIYFYRCSFTNIFPSYNQQECNVSWLIYLFLQMLFTNIFPSYNQQDAMFLDLFISTDALSRIYFQVTTNKM